MVWSHGPIELPTEEETARIAGLIAAALRPGDIILLSGPIGAGKSHVARSMLRALGVTEDIPSPTFTLVQTYDTTLGEVWHADLYRLSNTDELHEIGLDDALGQDTCLVEWPDRLEQQPEQALMLHLRANDTAHEMTLSSLDTAWPSRLEGCLV